MNPQKLRGFTLIELLVALSLLAVILAALTSAIRTMAQTETRIDQRLERQDELRVAHDFLQQTLSRVSALKVDVANSPGKKEIQFKATPQSLSWVGILPARPNVGGRYFFQLELEPENTSQNLVVRFAPWSPDAKLPDWSAAQSRILIAGITAFSVEAKALTPQGRLSTPAPFPEGWQSGWPLVDDLPQQVKLQIAPTDASPPEWIFAMDKLSQTDVSTGGVVIGGGSK